MITIIIKQTIRIPLLLLIFISSIGFSQTETEKTSAFKFETKYYKAVDEWVAFPKSNTDSTHVYGFIFIDNQQGFILHYESKFYISEKELKNVPRDSTMGYKKYKLESNTSLVSILTEKQRKKLNLPVKPKWLADYKKGSEKVGYLKNIGYHYNHVGASELALESLKKAYALDPHYQGLEFELAYAYNAIKEFDNAIIILKKAIENNPKNFYFYKELGYSYKNLSKIEKAEKTYLKGIEISENDFDNSEMAFNMTQTYFQLKNRNKFDEWAKLTRKYATPNSKYSQYIDFFEKEWNKR